MKIQLFGGLPFVSASLAYRGKQTDFENMLLDTGSAGTVLSSDKVAAIGLIAEPDDFIRRIRGVAVQNMFLASKLISYQLAICRYQILKLK